MFTLLEWRNRLPENEPENTENCPAYSIKQSNANTIIYFPYSNHWQWQLPKYSLQEERK